MADVLILVLMEYALEAQWSQPYQKRVYVLILVLMEYALEGDMITLKKGDVFMS